MAEFQWRIDEWTGFVLVCTGKHVLCCNIERVVGWGLSLDQRSTYEFCPKIIRLFFPPFILGLIFQAVSWGKLPNLPYLPDRANTTYLLHTYIPTTGRYDTYLHVYYDMYIHSTGLSLWWMILPEANKLLYLVSVRANWSCVMGHLFHGCHAKIAFSTGMMKRN